MNSCNQTSELSIQFGQIEKNENRTLWVIVLTLVMMAVEITAGYLTGSMALLADGYHMASHAGALGISFITYRLAKSHRLKENLNFGSGKLLPLGGYTSAVGLGFIALWMIIESIDRMFNPTTIQFTEAMIVAIVGFAVNVLSAIILGVGNHSHEHLHNHDHTHDHPHDHLGEQNLKDHNHESALMHVIADALTSVLAIFALVIGQYYNIVWVDPIIGIVGALVILKWAYNLCKDTAWELIDGLPKDLSIKDIYKKIESDGHKVIDLHLWKVGPGNHAFQLIVQTDHKKGSEYFRKYLPKSLNSVHLVIEER